MRRLEALLPAVVLLWFAFVGGAEPAALGALPAWLGRALFLALAVAGARELADPWRLGDRARWALVAALALAALSWRLSPAPRAGEVALVLLPALVLAVPALARGFARAPELAATAWSVAVLAIAGTALVDLVLSGGGRLDAPLGRRALVAMVLAASTPVAARGLRFAGGARHLATAATLAGGGALLATRSGWALVGFALAALVGARALERGRDLLAGLGLVAAGLAVPGLEGLARGQSAAAGLARAAAAASWRAATQRPVFGWGPGFAGWNEAVFRAPLAGLDGAGLPRAAEAPGPLELVGAVGAAGTAAWLVVAVLFFAARRREADGPAGWAAAGGLLATLVASLGGVTSAAGLWLALAATTAAAAMAEGAPVPLRPGRAAPTRTVLAVAYAAAAAAMLLPLALAQRDYERAAAARDFAVQRASIESAARRDPDFPLYAARAAWLPGPPAVERAARAWRAAESGSSVAALWLRAGWLEFEAGDHGATRAAFERALRLDPFGAAAPFLIFVDSGGGAVDCAARALLAEPRLLAAVDWRRHPPARAQALRLARRWPGIEEAWKERLLAAADASAPVHEEGVDWLSRLDSGATSAVSSRIFRRRAWPAELARIRLDKTAAATVRLAPAWSLAGTSPAAFPGERCAPPTP